MLFRFYLLGPYFDKSLVILLYSSNWKIRAKNYIKGYVSQNCLLCTYRLTLLPMVSWAAATDCFQWWRQVFPWVTPTRPIDFPQAHICQVLVKGRIASGVQQNKVVVIRWASWHDQMQKHIEDAMGSAGSEPNPTDVRKGNCWVLKDE